MNATTVAGRLFLGVDGGGTKTRAVLTDAAGAALGEGTSGSSNPLRVGVEQAAACIAQAVRRAHEAAGLAGRAVSAAQLGLAGVRRADVRANMRSALREALGIETIDIKTDADIALFGATGGKAGLAIIAGTGSICCGTNAAGVNTRCGGWGSIVGDEGSGFAIARRGLQCIAQAADGRSPATMLSAAACEYFGVKVVEDLAPNIHASDMTHERLAGFTRCVAEAARQGDDIARGILAEAGADLAMLAVTVIRRLSMARERFQIATVGGVFHCGEFVLRPLGDIVRKIAPQAYFEPPQLDPATAAAVMATRLRSRSPASASLAFAI